MGAPAIERSQATVNNVLVVVLLTFVILITSVDSSSIDGIVPLLQPHFNINSVQTASIRTATSAVNTATLALLWVFGEAFERRTLYLIALVTWIVMDLLSVVVGSQTFLVFVAFRSFGAGAVAIVNVLSPVIIADIFRDRALGIALMAVAVCELVAISTVAVVYSSFFVSSGLPWQYTLLPGPLLGLIPLVFLFCLLRKARNDKGSRKQNTFAGAFRLFKIKSYVLAALASSLSQFHIKALLFWWPSIVLSAWTFSPGAFFGMSYTSVTALNSMMILTGTIVGMPVALWIAQNWRYGTSIFSGRSGYILAYPIVIGIGGIFETFAYAFDILILDKNFFLCLISSIFAGAGAAAQSSLSRLMIFLVLPSNTRTAAMSLASLVAGIVSTPSAQFIGFISDIVRGDSIVEEDRFHAYQVAMLCSAFFMFCSSLCFFIMLAFYKEDCKKAEEEDAVDDDEGSVTTWLMGDSKSRSESLMYDAVRSRVQTLEG